MSAGLVAGVLLLVLSAGLMTAGPAAAVDDPTRPDARVTHGPSCRPGGLVVEVAAGSVPYAVRLATTRTPAGEDEAVLEPGDVVVLATAEVAWGETIDGRLEYRARDGSGVTFVDDLDHYTFTRPTQEDCAAVALPTQPEPVPPASAAPTSAPSPGSKTRGPGGDGSDDGSAGGPAGEPPAPSAEPGRTPAPAMPGRVGSASVREVAAGGTVTVRAGGFLPGERVQVQLGGGAVIGTATARADGSVSAEVRIPARTSTGPAQVALVGESSAVVADVELQVAATAAALPSDGQVALVPLVAAAAALVVSVGALVSVGGRQRTGGQRSPRGGRPVIGSA